MNLLEDILLPPVHYILNVHIPAKAIVIRHLGKLYCDVHAFVTFECDHAVGEHFPVFKLPLHLYSLVFLYVDVLTLDCVAVHLVLATWS